MTDFTPTWLDEPYPLDHTITWREHYARKQEAENRGNTDHAAYCRCVPCSAEFVKHLDWRIDHEDRMYEQNGPRYE